MKILQFVSSYAPHWQAGGPPRVFYSYARNLIDLGYQVAVFTAYDAESPESGLAKLVDGIAVSYYRRFARSYLRRFYCNYSASDITAWLNANIDSFDLVHFGQVRMLPNILMYRKLRETRKPYVVSAFGMLPRRKEGLKTIYDAFFVKPLIRDADALLAQTDHEAEEYLRYGASQSKIHLLPLPVAEIPGDEDLDKGAFRLANGIPSNSFHVIFLGRFHQAKGIGSLIDAFSEVLRSFPDTKLTLIGSDNGYLSEMESKVRALDLAGSVKILGPIYDRGRFSAYGDSDLYVIIPEVFEETSLASLEALSCGCPVLTTEKSEVPWLEEYGAGKIIKSGDLSAVVSGISQFIEDHKANGDRIRTNARLLVRERFLESSVARDLGSIFEAVKSARCS